MQKEFSEKEIRDLNQYLYDNSINLSKSQKTLFIASVLICFKIDDKILDGYDESTNSFLIANKMIEIINNYYDDQLFTNNFKFINKSLHNKHLYYIINKIKIDIKQYGKDILNQFYSDFCVWDRNNDGKLGIVLTPDDIVDIMVNESFKYYYELNGNKDNIKVIDFCMGTGSFLIKSSNYTKLLYGCENGDERYSLAKCNFILNDLDYNNLKYDSCFNVKYNNNYFDISIINPPFSNRCQDELNPNNTTNWKSYTKEQRFIMYQVELLKVNGIGCCIVPRNNFNNNIKANNEFKKSLMNYCQILEVINCNSKVFVPNANVECTILIFRKYNQIKNQSISTKNNQTKIIDYSDDGYKVKKNIRLFDHKPVIREQFKVLKSTDDWNYYNQFNIIQDNILNQMINEYNNDYNYSFNKYLINKNLHCKENNKMIFEEFIKYSKVTNWKVIRINEYFETVKVKSLKINECCDGIYPLISSCSGNNGICKYINKYSIEGEFISVARNGSVGSSFYQNGQISITTDIILLKPLKDINLHLVAMILNNYLPSRYSYSNKLSNDKIMNEIINVPIFE